MQCIVSLMKTTKTEAVQALTQTFVVGDDLIVRRPYTITACSTTREFYRRFRPGTVETTDGWLVAPRPLDS